MNCLTNGFASLHQLRDHLPHGFLAEAMLSLVNEDNPIWDLGGFKHFLIEPAKVRVII